MADIFITKPGSMFCVEEAVYSFLNLYSLSDICNGMSRLKYIISGVYSMTKLNMIN